ncbi:MAG: hypothetical protein B7733_01295 [Myxococcales bacterium FL481]|nr:MAG: hypothetical protein B7733_01295 [Myxococcales bacterium FL481]
MNKRSGDWRHEARQLANSEVPFARAQRMRRRLQERAAGRSRGQARPWSLMVAFVAGAATVLLIVRHQFTIPGPPRSHPADPATAMAVAERGAARDSTRPRVGCEDEALSGDPLRERVLASRCELRGHGVEIRAEDVSRVQGDPQRLHLHSGRLAVSVDPNWPRARPFVVATRGAHVEVTGTTFVVYESGAAGGLRLDRGNVRVTLRSGATAELVAGQHVTWGQVGADWRFAPDPAAPDLAPSHPFEGANASGRGESGREGAEAPPADRQVPSESKSTGGESGRRRAQARSVDKPARREAARARASGSVATSRSQGEELARQRADALVREIEDLRQHGRLGEAVERLRLGLPQVGAREHQVLSFELGKLLKTVHGVGAACDHWREHRRQHPRGSYSDLVALEIRRLGCHRSSEPDR